MFRLLRTIILVLLAFVAGMLFERGNAREACEAIGSLWIMDVCVGMEPE